MAHDLVSPKDKIEELKNRCRSPHATYEETEISSAMSIETFADVIVGCAQMMHDLKLACEPYQLQHCTKVIYVATAVTLS